MGEFAIKCLYRADGIHCDEGLLRHSAPIDGVYYPVMLEGAGVNCPACEGKGIIATAKGRELLAFLAMHNIGEARD